MKNILGITRKTTFIFSVLCFFQYNLCYGSQNLYPNDREELEQPYRGSPLHNPPLNDDQAGPSTPGTDSAGTKLTPLENNKINFFKQTITDILTTFNPQESENLLEDWSKLLKTLRGKARVLSQSNPAIQQTLAQYAWEEFNTGVQNLGSVTTMEKEPNDASFKTVLQWAACVRALDAILPKDNVQKFEKQIEAWHKELNFSEENFSPFQNICKDPNLTIWPRKPILDHNIEKNVLGNLLIILLGRPPITITASQDVKKQNLLDCLTLNRKTSDLWQYFLGYATKVEDLRQYFLGYATKPDFNQKKLLILAQELSNRSHDAAEQVLAVAQVFTAYQRLIPDCSIAIDQKIEIDQKMYDSAFDTPFTFNDQYYLKAGFAYYLSGNIDQAAYYYQQAVSQNPEIDVKINADLAQMYKDLGKWEDATEQFNIVIEKNSKRDTAIHQKCDDPKPDSDVKNNADVAQMYMDEQKWEDAAEQLNSVINKNPECGASIHQKCGDCYLSMGQYKNAVEQYNQSIEKNSDPTSHPYITLGTCYFQMNEFEQAITNFKNALDQDPENPLLYSYLGHCNYQLKNWGKASGNYRLALMYSSSPSEKEALESLINDCQNQMIKEK